jgi:hypothetical protein
MTGTISLHDARALALIDEALDSGFTPEAVAEITKSFELARADERDHVAD